MKDIKDILQELNLDLSNPEVVKAASEAIMQILAGRMGEIPETLKDRLSKKAQRSDDEDSGPTIDLGEVEQEVDPNLIQPPQRGGSGGEVETEIEDEDDVLSKVKQLGDSTDDSQDSNGSGSSSGQQLPDDTATNTPPAGRGTEDSSEEVTDDTDDSSGTNSGKPGESTDTDTGADTDETDTTSGNNANGGTPSEDEGSLDASDETSGGTTTDSEETDSDTDGTGTTGDAVDSEDGAETDEDGGGTEEDGEDSDPDFTSKVSGKNPKNEAQQIQLNRTLKAAQKAQEKAEDTGLSAIASLLEKCQEMIEDMLDELEENPNNEIAEQRLSQVIQKTLDAISEIDKTDLTFKSDEEREQQAKKIKDAMSDAGTAAELSAEDVEQIRADKQAIVNNQREIDKYSYRGRSSFKGFGEFLVSLRKALAMQVESEKTKAGSWAAINRRYDGTSVVKPGIRNKTLPSTKVPVIDFYFDCSASWGDHDLEKGNEALSKIAQLEKDGEIKVNVFYFADNVYADKESPRREGGTGAWNSIIENIVLTKATNIVIMTDRDMQRQCNNPPHKAYKVQGFVWYLWRDGECATNLPNLLQGRCGTMQFAFDSY